MTRLLVTNFAHELHTAPACVMTNCHALCRHQLHRDQFPSSLLLLKAQASAMVGNLAAADEAVQAWQNDASISQLGNLPTLTIPSRQRNTPACWQASWSASAAAKDKGNDLFRQGDFAGDQRFLACVACRVACFGQQSLPLCLCLGGFVNCY